MIIMCIVDGFYKLIGKNMPFKNQISSSLILAVFWKIRFLIEKTLWIFAKIALCCTYFQVKNSQYRIEQCPYYIIKISLYPCRNSRIQIRIMDLVLESNRRCSYDYIQIYDGIYGQRGPWNQTHRYENLH